MIPIGFKREKQFMCLGMVLLLLVAPIASIGVGATPPTNTHGDEIDVVKVSDDVDVWTRSVLPLRTVTENAETKIPNANWDVYKESVGGKPLNKSTIGVYNSDEKITVQFRSRDADQTLDNKNVHLVAARVSPNETPANSSEALDLLNNSSRTDVNENVAFYSADKATTDDDGHAELSFEPEQSGRYVLFLAMSGETDAANAGLSVDSSNNLTIEEQTTIVGVENALVQEKSSDVNFEGDLDGEKPDQGDTLKFDVSNTDLKGDNVRHAVLVYDDTTGWTYQNFTLSVSGNPSNLTELSENTTLEHSVDAVGGVARADDVTLFGQELDGKVTGTTPSIGTMFDFVSAEAELTADSTNGGKFLNASVTAKQGDVATIEVETLDNWPQSERYRWVHVAVNESGAMETDTAGFEFEDPDIQVTDASLNTSEITAGERVEVTAELENVGEETGMRPITLKQGGTGVATENVTLDPGESTTVTFVHQVSETGTYDFHVDWTYAGELTVKAKSDDGNNGGGSTGGTGGGGLDLNPTYDTEQQSDGSVLVDVSNAEAGSTIPISIPSEQATRVSGVTFEQLDIVMTNDNSNFDLTINTYEQRPSSIASDPAGADVKGYIEVEKQYISNDDIDQATFNFRVSADRLSEHSSPENVALYRNHEGSWDELDTTFVRQDGDEYVFEATTPGFSVFAVGEKQPDVSVTSADLGQSSVTVGETVEVTAEISNDGSGEGTYTAELVVDGEVVKTQDVTVGAGETEIVTFEYTPSETGEHSIAVGDEPAGTLTVTDDGSSGSGETTETTTERGGSDDDSDDGFSLSGISIGILVLLGLVAGLLYYFRDEVQQQLAELQR